MDPHRAVILGLVEKDYSFPCLQSREWDRKTFQIGCTAQLIAVKTQTCARRHAGPSVLTSQRSFSQVHLGERQFELLLWRSGGSGHSSETN